MRGESIPERGARNLLVMTGGRVAIHVVLVISAFWIPRALGAGTYGRYAAVLAVIQILTMLSTAGLPLIESRQLAPLWRSDRSAAVSLASTIWLCRLGLAGLSGLAAGREYHARVTAYNRAGYGPVSAEVAAVPKTQASAPNKVSVAVGSGTSLRWLRCSSPR